jgi:hypothetical protein
MELVYKAKSRIVSNNPQLNAGDVVFAKVKIFKKVNLFVHTVVSWLITLQQSIVILHISLVGS